MFKNLTKQAFEIYKKKKKRHWDAFCQDSTCLILFELLGLIHEFFYESEKLYNACIKL